MLGSKGIPAKHGVEIVVQEISKRLVALGHIVTVYGYDWYMKGMSEFQGCSLVPIAGTRNRILEMPIHAIRTLHAIIRSKQEFDVIHIHSVDPCLFLFPLRARYPIVTTAHGRAYKLSGVDLLRRTMSMIAERIFIGLSQQTTSVSKIDSEYYEGRYGGKVHYIPNGLPELSPGDNARLERWGIEPKEYMLFSAGRIIPSKGLDVLIEAYTRISTKMPLVVIGSGIEGSTYFRSLKLNAPDGVIFTGFISNRETLHALYANAKMAIFPSESEGMSMTLLEYLAAGIPVIYSNIRENSAIANGSWRPFPVGDIDALAQHIEEELAETHDSKHSELELPALQDMHDWQTITYKYLECYTNAIKQAKNMK